MRSNVTKMTRLLSAPAPIFLSHVLSVCAVVVVLTVYTMCWTCHAFTIIPPSTISTEKPKRFATTTSLSMTKTKTTSNKPFFFAEETFSRQQKQETFDASDNVSSTLLATEVQKSTPVMNDITYRKQQLLFDDSTLAEANDALKSVGWGGMALMNDGEKNQEEFTLTSDDPFVKRIDESIREEMGVGLDELLNPAKVVNLERDLYNLRSELATLTGINLQKIPPKELTTSVCDGGGGGEPADLIRSKISKKEKDLFIERKSVFRSWLKNVFLGQAVLSTALSYVMATNPDILFGNFDWYHNVSNMDTSLSVLGFWWWWLFIVPSLRSRRPTGNEKRALDMAFLGTPLISLLSPVVTKDTGLIWIANFLVVAGSYGYSFSGIGNSDGNELLEDDSAEDKRPSWLKFIYKSLDFGSGRERGARK